MNKVIYYKINNEKEILQIIKILINRNHVMIEYDPSLQYKVIDCISEIIYILKGRIKKITANQYLITVDKGEKNYAGIRKFIYTIRCLWRYAHFIFTK